MGAWNRSSPQALAEMPAANVYRFGRSASRKIVKTPLCGRFLLRWRVSQVSATPCRGGVPPPPGVGLSPALRRHARAAGGGSRPQRGTPGEGPPFNPLLRFVSTRGVPRAAARGQGSAPGPRPLFCKKAGQKTFIWRDFSRPAGRAPPQPISTLKRGSTPLVVRVQYRSSANSRASGETTAS